MSQRTSARIAGSMFLLYILLGILQMILGNATHAPGTAPKLALMSQHVTTVRVGMLLSYVICGIALLLAVTLHALTREVDRTWATFALACRSGEALVTAIDPLVTLGLLSLATTTDTSDTTAKYALGSLLLQVSAWCTTVTATLFAMGSTVFSWLFWRGRLIPRPLAMLGIVASVLLVIALPLQLVGFLPARLVQFLWAPMALFEIPLGVLLIIKGVSPQRSSV